MARVRVNSLDVIVFYSRDFLVVMLMVGVRGPVPAVLKELTVRKYCVYPFRPLMFTVY